MFDKLALLLSLFLSSFFHQPLDTVRTFANDYVSYSFAAPAGWIVSKEQEPSYIDIHNREFRMRIFYESLREQHIDARTYIANTTEPVKNLIKKENEWVTATGYNVAEVAYDRPALTIPEQPDFNFYRYYFVWKEEDLFVFHASHAKHLEASLEQEIKSAIDSLTSKQNAGGNAPVPFVDPFVRPTKENVIYGMYQPAFGSDIEKPEKDLNYHFGAQMFYKSVNSAYDPYVETMVNQRRVPVITFLFDAYPSAENFTYSIIEGKYDENIKDWATHLKHLNAPILLRLGNEMNADWTSWNAVHLYNDPHLYQLAFQHIVSVYKDNGAKNVQFVWNPNCISSPNYAWNQAETYYPGDAFVDWVGLTAYNFGENSFDELYRDYYATYRKRHPDKPMIIGEFGSVENAAKPTFIKDAFEKTPKDYPNIKIVIWFNGIDRGNDFRYNSSEKSRDEFLRQLQSQSTRD